MIKEAYGRFPKCSSCFFGPRPWHIEIRLRVKKTTSTINLFGFETLVLKTRRLKSWKPTVCVYFDDYGFIACHHIAVNVLFTFASYVMLCVCYVMLCSCYAYYICVSPFLCLLFVSFSLLCVVLLFLASLLRMLCICVCVVITIVIIIIIIIITSSRGSRIITISFIIMCFMCCSLRIRSLRSAPDGLIHIYRERERDI